MRRGVILLLATCSFAWTQAQVMTYKKWVKEAPELEEAFFHTPRAEEVGETVMLYQQTTGGWPKNINMFDTPQGAEREKALQAKNNVNESTIDNSATTTEIIYLSRLYNATGKDIYKDAALKGIGYLFEAQYSNGGWPQFYPRPKGYYIHITYNDNAMINVMKVLRDIEKGKAPFGYVPEDIREKARASVEKGIGCILKTQVIQDGKPTVWCAQHDRETLAPAKARAYELPSLSGAESDNIVMFLMDLPNPSEEIISCIENAMDWFRKSEIKGIDLETFTNEEGKPDRRVIPCDSCQPMWARFYELDTNRPFFCDRDGIKKYSLSEIGYERRNGYSWLNRDGLKVYKKYEKWKRKLNR